MATNSFSVSDPQTDQRAINAMNVSFDSIKQMIKDYKPKETNQDFRILNYNGKIEKDKSIYVDVPADSPTQIFCQYGTVMKYVGTLKDNTLTFTETITNGGTGKDKDEVYEHAIIYQTYVRKIDRPRTEINREKIFDKPLLKESETNEHNDQQK